MIVGWDYTWLQARLQEANALIWRQLGDTTGSVPGVNIAVLQAELAGMRTA